MANARRGIQTGSSPDIHGRVIVLDVEGSGLVLPAGGEIVEIGAVEIQAGRRTGRVFHEYVRPVGPVAPFATKIHGLTNGFLQKKASFNYLFPSLLRFIDDAPIIAHNAFSDSYLLENECRRAKLPPIPRHRFFCTQRIAYRLLKKPNLSLNDLASILRIDTTGRANLHSALVDARVAADCLLQLALMPGYLDLAGIGAPIKTRQERLTESRQRGDALRANCQITSSITAVFTLPNGRSVSAAIPAYPAETHQAIAHPSGVLMIRRQADGLPDNPSGPAIIRMTTHDLEALPFAEGQATGEWAPWPSTLLSPSALATTDEPARAEPSPDSTPPAACSQPEYRITP